MNSSTKLLVAASACVLMMGLASCGTNNGAPATDGGTSTATSQNASGNAVMLSDKKTEVTYFKAKAEMEVKSVTLGYMPDPSKPLLTDPAEDGNQFVRLEIAFTNTGEEPFDMSYTNISLTHTGEAEDMQTFLINDGNATDLLKGAELAPGESVSGAMYFEIPATDTMEDLTVHYSGYDGESTLYNVEL